MLDAGRLRAATGSAMPCSARSVEGWTSSAASSGADLADRRAGRMRGQMLHRRIRIITRGVAR
jgi:hypothetical protein